MTKTFLGLVWLVALGSVLKDMPGKGRLVKVLPPQVQYWVAISTASNGNYPSSQIDS